MREFGDWMKDMANSIPDESWTGRSVDANAGFKSDLHARCRFADLTVDYKKNPQSWIEVLCIETFSGSCSSNTESYRTNFKKVIGAECFTNWAHSRNDKAFVEALRDDILKGWVPTDATG